MTEQELEYHELAARLVEEARAEVVNNESSISVWAVLQNKLVPSIPFPVHRLCYQQVYEGFNDVKPTWIPSPDVIEETNIYKMMQQQGFETYAELYEWSITSREDFWRASVETIGIQWETPPSRVFEMDKDVGAAHVSYFPSATLNIADSCFSKRPPTDTALVYAVESQPRNLQTMSFGQLDSLSNQVAHALQQRLQLSPNDAVAICMPMTPECIAVYLGIVKAGCVVISIADSFSPEEIATRCRLGQAKAMFTQDVIYRGADKVLPLYARVLEAELILSMAAVETEDAKEAKSDIGFATWEDSLKIVVLPGLLHAVPDSTIDVNKFTLHKSCILRTDLDWSWTELLESASEQFASVKRSSMDACNILFSSGTTGDPKAIVWSHVTPIKCAVDGYYHQDIKIGDRVVWPTNVGWMMGPWLLFQMMNGATIGLFSGVASTDAFCEFVDEAQISMVGVIPSIVKAWQARDATKNCDWSCVKKFSSTGEASDPVNYHWLMSRVPGYAPVIEYCGGTEIGGSFLSSTIVHANVPSMFSSPVLGSQIMILSGEGKTINHCDIRSSDDSSTSGEIALVPPSIGLSTQLLNRDHYTTYFKGMITGPQGQVLRRHGDEIEQVRRSQHLRNCCTNTPYYRALGRCDDTMNIGGIKVGSVEVERVCNMIDDIKETAAIAVSGQHGGPCELVIYAVLEKESFEEDALRLRVEMQRSIKTRLNPLFRISNVVVTSALPRTASNKVMRRLLRDHYIKSRS